MIYILLIAPLIYFFFERRRDNRRAILVYSVINLAHTFLPTFDPAIVYYGGAALTDLIIITFLALVGGRLAKALIVVSFISILLNIGGYILWFAYRPLDVYNTGMLLLYGLALLIILAAGKGDDRRRTDSDSDSDILSDSLASHSDMHSSTKEK